MTAQGSGASAEWPEAVLSAARYRAKLGGVYLRTGREAEASSVLTVSLPILESAFGAGHPEVIAASKDLDKTVFLQRKGQLRSWATASFASTDPTGVAEAIDSALETVGHLQ